MGSIAKYGKNVKGFDVGDRVVADPGITVSVTVGLLNVIHWA